MISENKKNLTGKEIKKIKEEEFKKYNEEFIEYFNGYESASVFIVRELVKSINTRNKWVDVLSIIGYETSGGRWFLPEIRVEIFPRKIQPKYEPYPKDATEAEKLRINIHNNYLTWETAHKDIDNQRAAGFIGKKFEICTKLVNKNSGKFKEVHQKEIWNNYLNLWTPIQFRTPSCDENKIREIVTEQVPLKPKWEYDILSVKRI